LETLTFEIREVKAASAVPVWVPALSFQSRILPTSGLLLPKPEASTSRVRVTY